MDGDTPLGNAASEIRLGCIAGSDTRPNLSSFFAYDRPSVPAAAVTKIVSHLAGRNERIKKAAFALYIAGRWSTPDIPEGDQKILWEELRDALGIDKGTATRLGCGA